MDVQVMGAWGELLSGVSGIIAALGVIATLIYLARQIHQNTKAVQSTNLGTYLQALGEVHQSHREITDFFDDAAENRELSTQDRWRFHGHCTQVFHTHEAVFLFHLNGTVDSEYFESRMSNLRLVMSIAGFKEWWNEWSASYLDTRFIDFVNTTMADAEPIHFGQSGDGLIRRS